MADWPELLVGAAAVAVAGAAAFGTILFASRIHSIERERDRRATLVKLVPGGVVEDQYTPPQPGHWRFAVEIANVGESPAVSVELEFITLTMNGPHGRWPAYVTFHKPPIPLIPPAQARTTHVEIEQPDWYADYEPPDGVIVIRTARIVGRFEAVDGAEESFSFPRLGLRSQRR